MANEAAGGGGRDGVGALYESVSRINTASLRISSIQGNLTWQKGPQQLVTL